MARDCDAADPSCRTAVKDRPLASTSASKGFETCRDDRIQRRAELRRSAP